MFKNILLPIDVSDKHEPALNAAADLSASSGSEVTLLHVIELIPGLPMDEEKAFYRRLEKAAQSHLAKIGEKLAARKIVWRAAVLYGNRGGEVVRFARESRTDLIVLTAPQFDPLEPTAGFGSLSNKISLFAPCPVLLVK